MLSPLRSRLARFWPLPSLLVSLILIATASLQIWLQPYDGLYWSSATGQVTVIDQDGPAAAAGMQVGDYVLAINGTRIQHISYPYTQNRIGDTVTFSILRGNEPRDAEVTLQAAAPAVFLSRLEPVLIGLGVWIIGLVVLALRPGLLQARLFFGVTQLASGVLCLGPLSAFGFELLANLFSVLLCWLSALIVHFHSCFPVSRAGPRRRWLLRLFYAAAFFLSLPYVAGWVDWRRQGEYTLLFGAVRSLFVAAVAVSFVLLFRNYRLSTSPAIRRQIGVVMLATGVGFAPLTGFSLLPDVLSNKPIAPYELSFLFLILIPLFYAYAIYRFNLFQTDRILNRSLVYLALALFWGGVYLSLIGLLGWLRPSAAANSWLIGTLAMFILVGILPAFQGKAQNLIDRFLFAGGYNYRSVISHFSQALSMTIEETALTELLVGQLTAVLHVRGAALLVLAEDGVLVPMCCQNGGAPNCEAPARCLARRVPSLSLRVDGSLAQHLQKERKPMRSPYLRRMPLASTLAPHEQRLLCHPDLEVWLPLAFQEQLEGLLVLGSKMADEFYNDEDYRILETLAWQAATTTRNVRLVRELRSRLREITQGSQELQEAHRRLLAGREEERKHLAREIHDVAIQELIGINYRLRNCSREAQGTALQGHLQSLGDENLHLLQELRQICTDLRPPILDTLGLALAIRTHALEEVKEPIPITFDLASRTDSLPKDVAISLFRVYQEAIANAVKHAHANRVMVRLEQSDCVCVLSIEDDGCGFVVPQKIDDLGRAGHWGLVGMKERIEALEGELEITSTPRLGTKVKACVPLKIGRLDGAAEPGGEECKTFVWS